MGQVNSTDAVNAPEIPKSRWGRPNRVECRRRLESSLLTTLHRRVTFKRRFRLHTVIRDSRSVNAVANWMAHCSLDAECVSHQHWGNLIMKARTVVALASLAGAALTGVVTTEASADL